MEITAAQCLQSMLELSARMLRSAQNGDWEAVITLDEQRTALLHQETWRQLSPAEWKPALEHMLALNEQLTALTEEVRAAAQQQSRQLKIAQQALPLYTANR